MSYADHTRDRIDIGDIIGCAVLFLGFIALLFVSDVSVDPDDVEDCADVASLFDGER